MTSSDLGAIGIWTNAFDSVHVREAAEYVREAEELGYQTLWFAEVLGREAFANAGVYLASTLTINVATGIASIYGRDPTAANAAARTLEDAYQGRFILGLGVSHQPLVERSRKHDYTAPVATMAAYLDALAAAPLFAAGPPQRPPTVIAALGPRMLDLAREKTDGALTYLVTPEHTAMASERLGPDKILAVEQAVVLTEDRDRAMQCAHTYLEFYTGLPNYRNNWARHGFDETDWVRGGSERLASALVASGSIEDVVQRVAEHRAAGATHVCLQFLGDTGADVCADDWRRLAPALTDL